MCHDSKTKKQTEKQEGKKEGEKFEKQQKK